MYGIRVLNTWKNSQCGQYSEALTRMRKLLVVWIGAAVLLLWAAACGGQPATPTPTDTVGDVSTPTVSTPVPEATSTASPEEPDSTSTLVSETPGMEQTAGPTTGLDPAQGVSPTSAAMVTKSPEQTGVPKSTAAPPSTTAPIGQPPAPTPGIPPANTPTPAPPPTATPTTEPAPDIPVGSNVGNRAPEFTLTLTEGRMLTSEDLREQGQPVLLFFHSVH